MSNTNLKAKEETSNLYKGLLIEKIKIDNNRAIITLKNDDEKASQKGEVKMRGDISADFKNIWNRAKEIVIGINPKLYKDIKDLDVIHIQFYYNELGYLTDVSFNVNWQFDDFGNILNLNFIKYPIYKPTMDENVVAISGQHEDILHEILKEAEEYMKGKSKFLQTSLNLKVVK